MQFFAFIGMWLALFLTILTLTAGAFRISALDVLKPVSTYLHSWCLEQLPTSSHQQELAALVCGHSFESLTVSRLYQATGLIHLFVVSGSHLVVLSRILKKLKLSTPWILLLLTVYGFCSELNPPVTRSLIFLALGLTYRSYQPVGNAYLLLLSGLISILLNPAWAKSISLQMSWIAGLILCLSQTVTSYIDHLKRQSQFYLLYSLTFLILGFPVVSTILLVIITAPLLEFVLLPLSLVTACLHLLEPLFSFLINLLKVIFLALEFNHTPTTAVLISSQFTLEYNWILIFILQLLLLIRKT